MKTVGFPISHKENEKRRAIMPCDIRKLRNPECVYVETGFGLVLGISDDDYRLSGCTICSHEEVLSKEIVCDPKVGDADYLEHLEKGQVIFGWIHATQNREITDIIISNQITAYAWEKMYDNGRHVFWFNNELAGEAAILDAFRVYGQLPYGLNVAVIGNGNTARGACRVLYSLGANVMQYNRKQESILRSEIGMYDVIVNCVMWDVNRSDHIIWKKDLQMMKKNAMIIDVSCDRNGGIETCRPTTIDDPIYTIDGIVHYAVDHTPAIYYKTFSHSNSRILVPFIDELIRDMPGIILKGSKIIEGGVVYDSEIIAFQGR